MVGIANEPPRQLASSVGSAAAGFYHPGEIHHHQQRSESHQVCHQLRRLSASIEWRPNRACPGYVLQAAKIKKKERKKADAN
jgi:hypothetical protein